MANRLVHETSPYLRQHAHNPVDWYPWGEGALSLARTSGKPILLSIGYSACHWCHVMAHESFEDDEVAAIMNAHFVNIKVDREERPDLDHIYQTAHALLTRRTGGWPLTMFLTPDQHPFFGGTYFPKAARYGLPGFGDLLLRVSAAYRENKEAIAQQNQALVDALASADSRRSGSPDASLASASLEAAERAFAATFDERHGGFGAAPKFPHPIELSFLLERSADTGAPHVSQMVTTTLTHMARGGLFDQLGGGFCRYSVDGEWSIPHFEKMLYDNGLLLGLYAQAHAATGEPLYADVVRATVEWMRREMQSPEGGYYSSLDADSEYEEGKFYVWSREEIQARLHPDEFAVFAPVYGLDRAPNFENRHWHLRVLRPVEEVAAGQGLAADEARARLVAARAKLFAGREQRVRPGRDDKILVSWNALAITGMARAARVAEQPRWGGSARAAFEFIRRTMWRNGHLFATYNEGQARLNAYLDDYAFLLAATLELAQLELREGDLEFARELAEVLLARFQDQERGGFYFTSHDHEHLIHRPKTGHDTATPSGNGVAAQALLRLGHLVGEPRYLDAAERTLRAFLPQIEEHPNGHCSLLAALSELLAPPVTVTLRGPGADCAAWQAQLARVYRPHTLILNAGEQVKLPEEIAKPESGVPVAYVCRGAACLPPIASPDELERVLAEEA